MNGNVPKLEVARNIQFWHRSALDNLDTAKAMLRSKRYNFTMFMCQQTIEAILKCAYIMLKGDRPPFLHKLPRLLAQTEIKTPAWLDKILLQIDAHYIKARYFNDRFNPKIYNRENATKILTDTKRVLGWFVAELKLEK